MAARRWSDLSKRTRGLLIAGAAVESVLKVAVLVDLRRRPAEKIRGPKQLWVGLMVINSAGLAPLSYFTLGRRRDGD